MTGRPTVPDIRERVATHYGITERDLLSRCRRRHLSWPRHVAIYVARELTLYSLEGIAGEFWIDHTSVLHAIRNVEGRRRLNPETDWEVAQVFHLFDTVAPEAPAPPEDPGSRRKRVLAHLERAGPRLAREIAAETGIGLHATIAALRRLEDENDVARQGPRPFLWREIPPPLLAVARGG